MSGRPPELGPLVGKNVVLDTSSPYVYIGRLERAGEEYLVLTDADVHDMRDAGGTRDAYVVETKKIGVRVNRSTVFVKVAEIVSLSAIEEVVGF